MVYVGGQARYFSTPSFDCGTGEWRHVAVTFDDAFARVVAATAGGRYLVYASVVDNRSGDPVFVPGR